MNLLEVDGLKLYLGYDYKINDYLTLHQPTIGEIVEYGEQAYFNMVHQLTAIPSDMKATLWDSGIDWCKIEDFDLFCMLAPNLKVDSTRILCGDLDFSKLKPYKRNDNDEVVLCDKDTGVVVDKLAYGLLVNYVRKMHNITPKVEKAANKYTKQILIDEDRMNQKFNANKEYKSFLLPIISSVKVRMGYTREYVKQMGLYELMDDVNRLQIIVNSDALLGGMYSGMIDTSHLDKKQLNWMREA